MGKLAHILPLMHLALLETSALAVWPGALPVLGVRGALSIPNSAQGMPLLHTGGQQEPGIPHQ